MRTLSLAMAIVALSAVAALAQQSGTSSSTGARPGNEIGTNNSLPTGTTASNINSSNTRSSIAPRLPQPTIGDVGTPRDFLVYARESLAAGRTGVTQQALEMAQTRLLDRVVAPSQISQPSGSPAVADISAALQALAAHNNQQATQMIGSALSKLGPPS